MPLKKNPPPWCDLHLSSNQLAKLYGVSTSTAYRWKKKAGIPMRQGLPGAQAAILGKWSDVTTEDWAMGYAHVRRLVGVSLQAVQQMRKRLLAAGRLLPNAGGSQRIP